MWSCDSPPLCCCSGRWGWWRRWGSRTPDWHTGRAPRTPPCCQRGTCEWSSTQRTTAPHTRPATQTQHAGFPCSHLILQIPTCLVFISSVCWFDVFLYKTVKGGHKVNVRHGFWTQNVLFFVFLYCWIKKLITWQHDQVTFHPKMKTQEKFLFT